jgi:hypothetical protein
LQLTPCLKDPILNPDESPATDASRSRKRLLLKKLQPGRHQPDSFLVCIVISIVKLSPVSGKLLNLAGITPHGGYSFDLAINIRSVIAKIYNYETHILLHINNKCNNHTQHELL